MKRGPGREGGERPDCVWRVMAVERGRAPPKVNTGLKKLKTQN